MDEFKLSLSQLEQIATTLSSRLGEGLKVDDQEIGCLPTYLGLPSGAQAGSALVIDTGGTNTRAALVVLKEKDGEIIAGPNARKVPDGRTGRPLLAEEFFKAQADMAAGFPLSAEATALGYCFSYPAQATEDGDAILLRWTKGLKVEGVIGHKVGSLLKQALRHSGYSIKSLKVLNDTVASLLGGVHLYKEERFGQNYIGLILGTGTNMAGVFSSKLLTKTPPFEGPMVVNLESGNFYPPFLTSFDDKLDEFSDNPGRQRIEKAVSGHYLPQLFNLIHPSIIDPNQGAGKLVELREQGKSPHSETAAALLKRSAQLAAAAIVGLASVYPAGDTAVLGEGSLLWGDPLYADTMRQTFSLLTPSRKIELLRQRENVNLIGAACAALSEH